METQGEVRARVAQAEEQERVIMSKRKPEQASALPTSAKKTRLSDRIVGPIDIPTPSFRVLSPADSDRVHKVLHSPDQGNSFTASGRKLQATTAAVVFYT